MAVSVLLCVACSSHSKPSACPALRQGDQVGKACADLSVFVKPDASPDQIQSVGTALSRDPTVRGVSYVDQTTLWSEFSAAVVASNPGPGPRSMTAETTPSVYYVALDSGGKSDAMKQRYAAVPGVLEVITKGELSSSSSTR